MARLDIITKISDKDIKEYAALVEDGKEVVATNKFINKYILPSSRIYMDFISDAGAIVENNILSNKEFGKLSLSITSATEQLKAANKKLFSDFIRKAYAGVYDRIGITSPAVKEAITLNTIETYNVSIEGALSKTNLATVTSMRKLQREMFIADSKLNALVRRGLIDSDSPEFKALEKKFIKDLKISNPEFFKITKDGQMVVYSDGSFHKLDKYTEMATRTTAINTERNAVEVEQAIKGNRILEYYVKDKRAVKQARVICKQVLSQTLKGKSLVATDESAANILGIPFLPNVKAEGGLGVNCRHSVKSLSKALNNEIEKVLYLGEAAAI